MSCAYMDRSSEDGDEEDGDEVLLLAQMITITMLVRSTRDGSGGAVHFSKHDQPLEEPKN